MVYKILSQGGFWMVNKQIAKLFKCNNTALLLSAIIDKSIYHCPDNPDWFYYTSDDIEKDVNISYHIQKKSIQLLKGHGFVETKLIGIPARIHFKICENKISNFLNTGDIDFENSENQILNNSKSGIEHFQEQGLEEFKDINKELNKEPISKNNTLKEYTLFPVEEAKVRKAPAARKSTSGPTDEYNQEIELFFEYFTQVTGIKQRKMPDVRSNYAKVRIEYETNDIKEAIDRLHLHDYWCDKMTFELLFKRRKPNGDTADYINELLTERPKKNQGVINSIIRKSEISIILDENE